MTITKNFIATAFALAFTATIAQAQVVVSSKIDTEGGVLGNIILAVLNANNIPTTDAAAAMVPGFEPGGENDVFRQYSKKFTVMRPETPGYPFLATAFTKGAQDILNGADVKKTLDQMVADIDDNQKANNFFQQ